MVIESISSFLTKRLKMAAPDHQADEEVLSWQINIYLNYLFTFLLVAIIAIFTGNLIESLISMFSFILIRKFSGGMHLKSITACTILSAFIFIVIPLIEFPYVWILDVVSVIIFIKYAPNFNDELVIKYNPMSDIQSKLVCSAIVISSMVFDSSVLSLTFFTQAILILPILNKKEGRCV